MSASNAERCVANDARCPLAGERLVDSGGSKWSGLRVVVKRFGALGRLRDYTWPEGLVSMVSRGQVDMVVDSPAFQFSGRLYPGSLIVLPPGFEVDLLRWSGSHEATIVVLARKRVQSLPLLAQGERSLSLGPRFGYTDREAEGLIATMRMEVESDCPSGRVFAESVSIALAARLASNAAGTRPGEPRAKGALTHEQRGRVVEYVASHLDAELALKELAAVIAVSPGHFARMFRETFGMPPHHYVIEQRIEKAKRLIADGRQSILGIARSLGFASQSHFTAMFRKVTGMTPRQFHARL
jgi:AraC family transcriptional regulator